MQDNKNLLLATVLSAVVLISWTWFVEKPRAEAQRNEMLKQELLKKEQAKKEAENPSANAKAPEEVKKVEDNIAKVDSKVAVDNSDKIVGQDKLAKTDKILLDRQVSLDQTAANRVKIKAPNVSGSINLQGARFDDISLNAYKETIDPNSKNVELLSPADSKNRFFADFGWISSDANLEMPGANTIWQADSQELTKDRPVTLTWKNKQGVNFIIKIAVDDQYMFFVSTKVENNSASAVKVASYGRVSKLIDHIPSSTYVLHEGPIGVFDGIMHEMQYKDVIKKDAKTEFKSKKSWVGLTDKYWLAAIIPSNDPTNSTFTHAKNSNGEIFNVQFVGEEASLASGEKLELGHKLFAGAKQVTLLDQYSKKFDIDLFDRAVDFGWYYFLTKPFFFILKFFNDLLGNYGLAILAMTVLVKIAMLPLAAKSYKAMARIKKLHPNIEEIKKNHGGNKMQMNKSIMELYKKENINPAAGCLPMLIQIPVFFSLYKVLYVTIDMRHQPFFGWIKDLSAPDPTTIFNLFGLLPFEIHAGVLMIGIWPILMGITMILQQKLGPKMTDPVQAKVMKILPFMLIFLFAAFPAGLLIYWTWNNILSIIQQYFVTKKVESEGSSNSNPKKKKA